MDSTEYTDLTIIIPAKNEEKTLGLVLDQFLNLLPGVRLIVVDNGSWDNTYQIAKKHKAYPVRELLPGKGNALKAGLALVQTNFVAFHDADSEYDPKDCIKLYYAMKNNPSSVWVGNRVFLKKSSSFYANLFMQNILFLRYHKRFLYSLDILSGTRMGSTQLFKLLDLSSADFRIETEFVKKCIVHSVPIQSLPVTYNPRTYKEGKKIKPSDIFGLIYQALWP